MKLSVSERLHLLNLIPMLPKEGDYTTLRIIRDLQNDTSFSEAEFKETNLRLEEGLFKWDKNVDKDVPIGEKATEMIVDTFKKLDEQKKLAMQFIDLYERFIEVA